MGSGFWLVSCGPHGSVCSPVTQHIKELLERNSKKKSKLRKKAKPYVEEPDGRASAAWALLCTAPLSSHGRLAFSNRFWAGGGTLTSGLGPPKQAKAGGLGCQNDPRETVRAPRTSSGSTHDNPQLASWWTNL